MSKNHVAITLEGNTLAFTAFISDLPSLSPYSILSLYIYIFFQNSRLHFLPYSPQIAVVALISSLPHVCMQMGIDSFLYQVPPNSTQINMSFAD